MSVSIFKVLCIDSIIGDERKLKTMTHLQEKKICVVYGEWTMTEKNVSKVTFKALYWRFLTDVSTVEADTDQIKALIENNQYNVEGHQHTQNIQIMCIIWLCYFLCVLSI